MTEMPNKPEPSQTPITDRIEVAGDQLVGKMQQLVAEGKTKRVVIKDQHDKELMSIPLNVGVAAGGLVTLAAPGLAAIGAVAGLVARVKLDIERIDDGDDHPETPSTGA